MNGNKFSRIMLAASKSGSGKTALTCGLLNLLRRQDISVTSFKCGPDYIDPMFHREVLQVPSYNLDTYFTGEDITRYLFMKHAASSDLAVIEGVMGYFDGLGGTAHCASSCHLAEVTDTPVILVVDAKGMSRSVSALIRGFCTYREKNLIKGVILNRTSAMLYPKLKELIENETGIRVLGYVAVSSHVDWSSRHLGLLQPEEIRDFRKDIDAFSDELAVSLDIKAIQEIAESAAPLRDTPLSGRNGLPGDVRSNGGNERRSRENASSFSDTEDKLRIGIAKDPAFTFYYQDNLELLEEMGCELLPFSPINDKALPAVDGVLLGGGYPELHLKELSENECFKDSLRKMVSDGMPVLAECGGFMYLQQTVTGEDGVSYPMAGILDGQVVRKDRLVRFGYASFTDENGLLVKGHEFHYFDSTENGSAWQARKPVGGRSWRCEVVQGQVTAGFPHLYYYSEPEFVEHFLEKCRRFKNSV